MNKKNQLGPLQAQINSVIALYSNGQIQEALDSVGALIKDYPNEALLYNVSGACYAGLGQLDTAVKSYEQALAIKPDYAEAHNNLGNAFKELGQLDTAVKSYEQAIAIKPDFADVHYNLGVMLQELGQLDDAVKSYEQALAIKPDYAEAFNNLGSVLKELGQLDTAVKSYERILVIKPDFAEAHNNLGIALKELGQLDDAVKSYEQAIVIKADYAEAHNNLGIALKELGQLDTAVKSYEQALVIKPDFADAHYNLGNAFKELEQLDTAVKSYEQAIVIKADYAEAFNNLGSVLKELGQLDDAVKRYELALAIKPDYADVHNNLGIALKELGQLDAALKSCEQALAIKPDFADAHYNLGIALQALGQLDEALASYDRAIVLKPDINFILGVLLHAKMHLCIWDDLANRLNELTNKINNGEKAISPFALLALIDDPEIQRKTAEIYAKEGHLKSHVLSKIERYPKHKKIRIGYFSADFHDHATMHLMAELFECHDKNNFELIAFSFGPNTQDKWRKRTSLCFDQFVDVKLKSDREISLLARKMEIDIAVNLGGYTENCRTEIFAMSAAAIQVSYLGYPGTMAVDYINYLIADRTLIPEEKQHHYSEKIVYMPNSYQVNISKRSVSEASLLRHELGLPKTGFIFCCFNNNYKITPSVFTGWMRILKAVEDSVLWLFLNYDNTTKNLKKEAMKFGINEDRLVFAKYVPAEEHLNRIKQADLFIDTLPYNAHTTASDALRMGLPVLTCMGNSFASRVAASLLNAVNLPELITTTQEQYESLAIELATHPEKLKIIKDKLVDNLPTAPLYDTPLFTRHLESAYLTMYDRYQHGLDPDHIYVEDYKQTATKNLNDNKTSTTSTSTN